MDAATLEARAAAIVERMEIQAAHRDRTRLQNLRIEKKIRAICKDIPSNWAYNPGGRDDD
jgi:predicted protein tyrosine phosphatase